MSNDGREFPRELTDLERKLIFGILPEHSRGYSEYRAKIDLMKVVGLGKRGAGHLVLSENEVGDDLLDHVAPVFAVGGARQGRAEISIVMHELEQNSISVELMMVSGEYASLKAGELTMWAVSDWLPQGNCPKCGCTVREVVLPLMGERQAVIAMCPGHRSIWVYDSSDGVNRIVPLSGFMNELNAQKALRSGKREHRSPSETFAELSGYPDNEIVLAFTLYNKFRRKLDVADSESPPLRKSSVIRSLYDRMTGGKTKSAPGKSE